MYYDCYGLVLPLAASGSYRYTYIRDVVSQELGNTRDLVIYTPPSYYENPFKSFLDLLIMHDGQNLFNASTSFAGVAWQVRLCPCVSSYQAPRFT
jgi:predicted alpha/beta superfamily hydrolase